jgi:fucose permease
VTHPNSGSSRRLVPLTWATFVLLGWTSVLVPALLRQIEARFGVDDASMGLYYFVYAASYATGSFTGGVLVERLGRRLVMPAAAALMGIGLLGTGVAPSWLVFAGAAVLLGAGGGVIDGGVNGLALAIADEARGRALNLLHLAFAIGAFVSPVVVGQLVEREIAWEGIFVVTAVAAVVVAVALRTTPMPSGVHAGRARTSRGTSESSRGGSLLLPLILLAVAIGCFVASEVGVSNWISRFLASVPVTLATAALSAFWGGLALGRLFAARYSDQFSHSAFAAIASVVAGVAVTVAVVVPTPELSVVAFAVAGFAMGPIFPMIIALGGDLYPDRSAATGGTLTGAAVLGGMIYPPLIGLMSAGFGIGAGLLGAAGLSIACAVAILVAARTRARRTVQESLGTG